MRRWESALSTVNAVYLIVDRENGRKYVGSAYGKGGLLGRQLLPKAVTPDEVIQTETLWKKKLRTYEPFGMNQN